MVCWVGECHFLRCRRNKCSFQCEECRETREKQGSIHASVCCCCVTSHVQTQWLQTSSICVACDAGGGQFRLASVLARLPLVSVAASGLAGWVLGALAAVDTPPLEGCPELLP